MTIQLFQPDPAPTMDANQVAGWMNSEIDAIHEEDNARFEAEAALEMELTAPFVERARELGFDPAMADTARLEQHLESERDRRRSDPVHWTGTYPPPAPGRRVR